MEKTALQFFENFILSKASFNNIEEVLLETTLEPYNGTNLLCITSDSFSDNPTPLISYFDTNTQTFSSPPQNIVRNFFIETINYNKQLALKNLFTEIDKTSSEEKDDVLKNKLQNLTYLINSFSEKYKDNKFSEIKEALIQIELELCKKYEVVIATKKSLNKNAAASSQFKKIKWNGNTNILTTLFYELSNEFLNEGEKFIDLSSTELAKFISECFLDKDGNDFSIQTLETYFSKSRHEKRAKSHKKISINTIIKKASENK